VGSCVVRVWDLVRIWRWYRSVVISKHVWLLHWRNRKGHWRVWWGRRIGGIVKIWVAIDEVRVLDGKCSGRKRRRWRLDRNNLEMRSCDLWRRSKSGRGERGCDQRFCWFGNFIGRRRREWRALHVGNPTEGFEANK
jgi:hypothetical protein